MEKGGKRDDYSVRPAVAWRVGDKWGRLAGETTLTLMGIGSAAAIVVPDVPARAEIGSSMSAVPSPFLQSKFPSLDVGGLGAWDRCRRAGFVIRRHMPLGPSVLRGAVATLLERKVW